MNWLDLAEIGFFVWALFVYFVALRLFFQIPLSDWSGEHDNDL